MAVSPWHQLCTLREDVRSGTLTLAEFAADLNAVRTGEAPPVYGEPAMFFDRTYPTFRMKVLTHDVLSRLAGQGGKPVLQLQVAYGGGKTHTLIALLHLAERGATLAEGLPSPAGGRGAGGEGGLSAALDELVDICEEKEKWTPILIGELEKAREIQAGLPTLSAREIEQAVVATFLHSQPIGQRAAPSELLALLAHPAVDAAALEEGLRKWRDISWFLVENPEVWQLSTTPNLTRMHDRAMDWLNEPEIDDELKRRIRAVPILKTTDPGVEVHTLPQSPRDVSDDLKLHHLILGPECAMELGKPLPVAVEAYFNEKTSPQDPRIYRNNILALVPEVSRVAGLREQVRRWLGWGRLEWPEVFKLLTDQQKKQLPRRKQEAANGLPEAAVAAYNILVAVDETGQVRVQTLRADSAVGGTPFERIRATLAQDERLVTTTLDPDLILPGSYLELWAEGQSVRRVTDLMAAFGQFPRLPRLLRPASLFDTLVRGLREGVLVLRLPRADGSVRTWWRIPPDEDTLRRLELEVQPASLAVLHDLEPGLLESGRVDGLWPTPTGSLGLEQLRGFFDGVRAPRLATPEILDKAVRDAVERGRLMARWDDSSLFREPLPEGALPAELELLPPPPPIRGADLTPQALPQAWKDDQATLQAIADVLAAQHGYTLPWMLLREGVDEALHLRLFEHIPESLPWPCSPAAADQVRFRLVEEIQLAPEMIAAAVEYTATATPTLGMIKEAIETRFLGRTVPSDLFIGAVGTAIKHGLVTEADEWRRLDTAPDPLAVRICLPAMVMLAEATLDPMALQKLAERVEQLLTIAPELAFTFRVALSAEGQRPDAETLQRLNELLEEVQAGWKLA